MCLINLFCSSVFIYLDKKLIDEDRKVNEGKEESRQTVVFALNIGAFYVFQNRLFQKSIFCVRQCYV